MCRANSCYARNLLLKQRISAMHKQRGALQDSPVLCVGIAQQKAHQQVTPASLGLSQGANHPV